MLWCSSAKLFPLVAKSQINMKQTELNVKGFDKFKASGTLSAPLVFHKCFSEKSLNHSYEKCILEYENVYISSILFYVLWV